MQKYSLSSGFRRFATIATITTKLAPFATLPIEKRKFKYEYV
jgi:hypothetical protein